MGAIPTAIDLYANPGIEQISEFRQFFAALWILRRGSEIPEFRPVCFRVVPLPLKYCLHLGSRVAVLEPPWGVLAVELTSSI